MMVAIEKMNWGTFERVIERKKCGYGRTIHLLQGDDGKDHSDDVCGEKGEIYRVFEIALVKKKGLHDDED